MLESQEPDHTTTSFSGASPARKMEDLGSILKRIVKERSNEHVSTHPRLPQEIVQKKTLWCLDKDPLNWWKDKAKHLPLLARLANKYLCACAMSVPLE